jgi:hypothetical protein
MEIVHNEALATHFESHTEELYDVTLAEVMEKQTEVDDIHCPLSTR